MEKKTKILLGIGVLAVAGYIVYNRSKKNTTNNTNTPTSTPTTTTTTIPKIDSNCNCIKAPCNC